MASKHKSGANFYNGVPEKAVDQFRDACERLLYPDGSDTLRPDAFGPFPANVLENTIRERIESVLGDTVENSTKEQVITNFAILACADMRFFQEVQYRMCRQDIRVPFYSAFDAVLEKRMGAPRESEFDASGLALGMDGKGNLDGLLSHTGLGTNVARAASSALAAKVDAMIPPPEPVAKPPAKPADPMAAAWEAHGEMVLDRAGDASHTLEAVEAMRSGRANQFHRDMTPANIRRAQTHLHDQKNPVAAHERVIFDHQLATKGPDELRAMLEMEHELLDSAFKSGTAGKDDQVKHSWRYEAIRDTLQDIETGHEASAAR